MGNQATLNGVYSPSEDIVAREIEGELIIIPITSGIGESEDEIFTLNETARIIWDKLNGERNLKEVVHSLSSGFEAPRAEIEKDVLGLVKELLTRRILVEIS